MNMDFLTNRFVAKILKIFRVLILTVCFEDIWAVQNVYKSLINFLKKGVFFFGERKRGNFGKIEIDSSGRNEGLGDLVSWVISKF